MNSVMILGEVAVPAMCGGTMVRHGDGTSAACSEELEGRCCAGSDAPHLGDETCEDVLGPGGCEYCLPDAWDDRDWRHAVRIGGFARTQRRCPHQIRAVRFVPESSAPFRH